MKSKYPLAQTPHPFLSFPTIRLHMSALSAHKEALALNFTKCVTGYHLVNSDPIKETVWESINARILHASGVEISAQSAGSHKPGADLGSTLGAFSNKTTQYNRYKTYFDVSSYRLTTVCSEKTPGTCTAILAEIDRRKNFQYYSILVRSEEGVNISYDWYLIPADHPALNPSAYTWGAMTGKRGKNKGEVVGWETNSVDGSSMHITFSMSSQLWIRVYLTEDLRSFIVGSATVKNEQTTDYISLADFMGATKASVGSE